MPCCIQAMASSAQSRSRRTMPRPAVEERPVHRGEKVYGIAPNKALKESQVTISAVSSDGG
jgi:hypothetical protein